MAVSMREFTEDMCITFNERVYTIVECIHLSPIKGPALVRTKLRDIETGEVISNNFNAAAEVAFVETEKKAARFVGEDAGAYLFEALDESGPLKLAGAEVGSAKQWLSADVEVSLIYIDDAFVAVEPLVVKSFQ